MRNALLVLLAVTATKACDIFVSPTGSDSAAGTSASAALLTLAAARDKRRMLPSTPVITICLTAGTFALSKTLELDARDSSTAWRGGAGTRNNSPPSNLTAPTSHTPTITGGIVIPHSAWTHIARNTTGQNELARWESNITSLLLTETNGDASVAATILAGLRHLYVNGSRAARTIARGTSRGATQKRYPGGRPSGTAWGSSVWIMQGKTSTNFSCDDGVTTNCSFAHCGSARPVRVASLGFEVDNIDAVHAALSWPNAGKGVELVFSGVDPAPWAESRCAVTRVSPTSHLNLTVLIEVERQCMTSYAYKCLVMGGHDIYPPTGIENVGVLQLAAGTFYIDKMKGVVAYAPRSNVTVPAAAGSVNVSARLFPLEMAQGVVLPIVEQLILGAGTKAAPIMDVSFAGISFAETTWGRVAREAGYVEVQSGKILDGFGWPGGDSAGMTSVPGGALAFHNCSRIIIDRCDFRALGSAGVELSTRAQDSVVSNSFFRDLSGAAVTVGVWDNGKGWTGQYFVAPQSVDPADFDTNNTIQNNTVAWTGVEYRGSAAICAGYTARSVISGNTLSHLPNTALSVGWGWGRGRNQTQLHSMMENNLIDANEVHDYKRVMNDGGCVYTQSNQPGTIVRRNWCDHQAESSGGGGVLYPDEGSGFMEWSENVVTYTQSYINAIDIWTGDIHDISFVNNFADTKRALNKGSNCSVVNTTVFPRGEPTSAAAALIAGAGVNTTIAPKWQPAPAPLPNPPRAPANPPAPHPPPSPTPSPTAPADCPNATAAAAAVAKFNVSPGLIGHGGDVVPKDFTCVSVECCPGESALLCEQLGAKLCNSFALNEAHWFHGLKPQMYTAADPATKHPHGGWTFYGVRS